MLCNNISINEKEHLSFGGIDTIELAKEYGTPVYLMDENRIRHNCRIYTHAMKKYFGDNSLVLYASKAAAFKRMYQIVSEEQLGLDVVSSGEIYTALKSGCRLDNAYFHSNNKTDFDIDFAIKNKIGYFVVDNIEELLCIQNTAKHYGIKQKIILRITPGIDTHTYEAVNTGKVDSKFGSAIETGQADEITVQSLKMENIQLCGFHCHIGSQVFDSDTFLRGSDIMLDFIAHIKSTYGYEASQLDLGGGYGVKYVEADPNLDIDYNISLVARSIKAKATSLGLNMPKILMEPGRSITADAGMTLYTVGTVKSIPEYKNYVSVDGGMTDNPRYALYGSLYTVMLANKPLAKRDFHCSVVGRCCESGDIIQENVYLPEPKRGDIVAVLTTGAYNYSMSSNYNRIPRPPVVMINHGQSYIAVKKESLDDLIYNDL